MNIVMFAHAGSNNHGCEAIVRSTCAMLGSHHYYLESAEWASDVNFQLNELVRQAATRSGEVPRNSFKGLAMRAVSRLSRYSYEDLESLDRNRELLVKDSVALSIGGDNYFYGGIILSIRDKLRALKLKQIPTVLWGCSVDKDRMDIRTIEDLKSYSAITARESITVENLAELGISDNIIPCTDPAFTLARQTMSFYDHIFASERVIGINVSDFMKNYNAYPDATLRNFQKLLSYILKETDCRICMIPHVIGEGNNDLVPMRNLMQHFNSERIFVADKPLNCMQLKDIIARCHIFIGCRTHATIAAYSSCVPTLVVGYSTKAKGICRDIFGTEDNLLVDGRKFTDDDDLLKLFLRFWEQKEEFRKHLQAVMPDYISKSYCAKQALDKLT